MGTVPWLLTATSDKNSLYQECSLGDAVTDAIRTYMNADIAIVNGGDLTGNLPPGDITWDDLKSSIVQDRTLATVVVTAPQLRDILESALSYVRITDAYGYDIDTSPNGAFPQISGFRLYYDPAAPLGQRVVRIIYGDAVIDMTDVQVKFKLAATANMFDGGYGLPKVADAAPSKYTLRTLMAKYIQDGLADYSRSGKRIYAMGVKGSMFPGSYTVVIIVVLCCVFFVITMHTRKIIKKIIKPKSDADSE